MNDKKKAKLWLLGSVMLWLISVIIYMDGEKMWATKATYDLFGVEIIFYGNPPEPSVITLLIMCGVGILIIVGYEWIKKKE